MPTRRITTQPVTREEIVAALNRAPGVYSPRFLGYAVHDLRVARTRDPDSLHARDGQAFRTLLRTLTEEGVLASRTGWDAADLGEIRDPLEPRKGVVYYALAEYAAPHLAAAARRDAEQATARTAEYKALVAKARRLGASTTRLSDDKVGLVLVFDDAAALLDDAEAGREARARLRLAELAAEPTG